jgi:hypothetical protein
LSLEDFHVDQKPYPETPKNVIDEARFAIQEAELYEVIPKKE